MQRDILKIQKEGEQLLAAHTRVQITIEEAETLRVEARGGALGTTLAAFYAGAAIGARIVRAEQRRRKDEH